MATLADLAVKVGVDDTEVGKGTKRVEGKFDKLWSNVGKAAGVAGAAMGAALGVGLMKSFEREAGSDMLAARINLDPAQQEMAGRIAGDLYADAWGESLTQVNDTFAAVFREVGDVGETELKGLTEHAQRFTDVFAVDSAAAVKTAGALVKNELAPDMVGAFDLMAAAAQEINIPAEELLDNLNEYAEPLSSIGIDGSQAIGMLNSAMGAGVKDVDKALDALKEFAIRSIDGSTATIDAYESIGLNADKMAGRIAKGGPAAAGATSQIIQALMKVKDPVEQDAAGVALFGSMWEDIGPKAIAALDPMAAGMVDVTGRSEDLNDAFDNQSAQIETWKREAETWLTDLATAPGRLGTAGAAVAGFGAVAASSGADIGGISMALSGLSSLAGKLKLGAAASAIGSMGLAAVTATGRLIALTVATVAYGIKIAVVKIATLAWTAAQWLFNIAVTANPIGLIVLAIVALIAIVVLIVKHWDTLKAAFAKAWDWIWNKLKAFGAWFMQVFWENGLKRAINLVISHFNFMKNLVGKVFAKIRSDIGTVVGVFRSLPGKIKSGLSSVGRVISAPFKWAFNQISSFWNSTAGQLSFSAPGWVPGIGGKGFSLPKLPMLADGGNIRFGGSAIVGENGPEVLNLPRGAQVQPLDSGSRDELRIEVAGEEEIVRLFRFINRKRGGRLFAGTS